MICCEERIAAAIASIKNLKMIHYYRLFDEEGSPDAIMAYYEDKTINLCSADGYYNELFDKLVRQYALESADSLIFTDDNTRKILTDLGRPVGETLKERLSEYTQTDTPLFLPKAFAHLYVMPVAEYILKLLYGDGDDAITFEQTGSDWFGQGVLCGISRDRILHFPYQIIQKSDDTFGVILANALRPGDMLDLEVAFEREKIYISFTEDAYLFHGDVEITADDADTARISVRIKEADKPVAVYAKECAIATDELPSGRASALLAAGKEPVWKGYRLPWGDIIFRAADGKEVYQILSAERFGCTISHGTVFCRITDDKGPGILFGRSEFRLYEREDMTELHMLDTEYPRSAEYALSYAGKVYRP